MSGDGGVTVADEHHPIMVNAEALGPGHEARLLQPVLEGVGESFAATSESKDGFKHTTVPADSGCHNKDNVKRRYGEDIDGCLADVGMGQRDERFAQAKHKHRPSGPFWGSNDDNKPGLVEPEDFAYADGPMQWLGRKVDSAWGRHPYSTRLGTAQPLFAPIG